MALQRTAASPGAPASPAAAPAPHTAVSPGPALSTRETINRPFIELGVMFGQALGGREPVMQALTNLQNIGQENGCDAVIAVKLLHYPTSAGPAVVAYGTGVRFLPHGTVPEPGVEGVVHTDGTAAGMAPGAPVPGAPAGGGIPGAPTQ